MGQSVEVVVAELSSASGRLEAAAQRLRDGLASVDAETTQLMGAGWKGDAASAYGPAWATWHDGAEQVVLGLQRMSELLSIAGKEYAKTDESASDALASTMQGSGSVRPEADAARQATSSVSQLAQGAAGLAPQAGQAVTQREPEASGADRPGQ